MISRLVKRTTRRYLGALLNYNLEISNPHKGWVHTICFLPESQVVYERSLSFNKYQLPQNRVWLKHTVGLALPSSSIFHLKAREVCIGLNFLDEWHLNREWVFLTSNLLDRHPSPNFSLLVKTQYRNKERRYLKLIGLPWGAAVAYTDGWRWCRWSPHPQKTRVSCDYIILL